MLRNRFFLILLILFCLSLPARAQRSRSANTDRLFSPSVGQQFYEIAHELTNAREDISGRQVEEGVAFLIATMELDSAANYILPDMIRLICRRGPEAGSEPEQGYAQLVYQVLIQYVDEYADLEVTEEAVRYLLEQVNSREEREELLGGLLEYMGDKNPVLDSEIATLLGLLMAEKANTEGAQFYFMHAVNANKYNNLAFTKLAELAGGQIEPVTYLQHLRLRLGENPLDMQTALAFAQYTEQAQLYRTAAGTYEYCADLFRYLYPSEALPAWIYIPWTISNYNTQRNQHKCLEIADQLRQSGRFDLFAETVAAKAAAKTGNAELADQILREAAEKANKLVIDKRFTTDGKQRHTKGQLQSGSQLSAESLAWFYCFGLPDTDKALEWANKAYAIEPNSTTGAALLAYSLVMNDQGEWTKTIIDSYQSSPITDLAMAQIQLQKGEKSSAIESLKSAIAQDPASLEAHRAKEILAKLGSEYVPPTDPAVILMALTNSFEQGIVPTFISPGKIISVQLNARGSRFAYGREFGGSVTITNNSAEPLVISDDGMFTGNIRIDATIAGDINKRIDNLITVKIQPASPVEPGRSLAIPLKLVTAELRDILFTYPQASLDIEFIAYLDPVVGDEGPMNRIGDIRPAKLAVKRPGVKLTDKFLRNKLNSISKGPKSQRADIALLFISLLAEQHAQANREPLYKFKYADWMPVMLKSALLQSLANDDWVTRTRIMAGMLYLPMDYELTNAVAANLSDAHWPVRLMAVYLLAKNQESSFAKVLDWTSKYDSNQLVREMAIALGAARPKLQKPLNQPPEGDSEEQTPSKGS